MRFIRENLRSGQWVHVRSHKLLGCLIRSACGAWEARVCKRLGVPAVPVWGNHDGLVIGPDIPNLNGYGICEALADGNHINALESYEQDSRIEVRVFEPLAGPDPRAVLNWECTVWADGYDYWAVAGLAMRGWLGWDVSTQERDHFYCTEGAARGYRITPPGLDLLQDSHVAPHHVEQAAGLIPRPAGRLVTMREITERCVIP